MSRYTFEPQDGVTVIVGWDNPIQTFFGIIESENSDVPEFNTMIDRGWFDIRRVDTLSRLIGYQIPEDIVEKLENDHRTATEPTALQKQIGEIFGR